MKGWVMTLLADLQRTLYPYKWLPISCSPVQTSKSSPVRDRRSTSTNEPCTQSTVCCMLQLNGDKTELLWFSSATHFHWPGPSRCTTVSSSQGPSFVICPCGSTQSCQCANMSCVLRGHVFHLRRRLLCSPFVDYSAAMSRHGLPRTLAPGLLQRCSCRSSSGNTGTTADSPHWSVAGLHHRSAHTGRQRSHARSSQRASRNGDLFLLRTERRTAHSLSLNLVHVISCRQGWNSCDRRRQLFIAI